MLTSIKTLTTICLLLAILLAPAAQAEAEPDAAIRPDCELSPMWPSGGFGCQVGSLWVGCTHYTGALLLHDRDSIACGVFGCPYIGQGEVGRSVYAGFDDCVVYAGHTGLDDVKSALAEIVADPATQSDASPVSCTANPTAHGCTVDVTGRDTGVRCGVLSVGYQCGLLGFDCASVLWGIHNPDFVVGGNNGCHAKVWVGFLQLGAARPVDCTLTPEAHGCTKEIGGRDTGVYCGAITVGYNCGIRGFDCTQAHWGIHQPGLVVGGYNGCHVMAWVGLQS